MNISSKPALEVATVKSDASPCMLLPFLAIVILLDAAFPPTSTILTNSPLLGEPGRVTVTAADVVSIKKPCQYSAEETENELVLTVVSHLPKDTLALFTHAEPL